MDASVTIKLGPSVEAGGQGDEVPLKGTFVLRDACRQRLEADDVRPSASGMRRRATSTWDENQFAFKRHSLADSQSRNNAHADNPQKSLMFADQPIRELRNTDNVP
jgi:hypothetical protein